MIFTFQLFEDKSLGLNICPEMDVKTQNIVCEFRLFFNIK